MLPLPDNLPLFLLLLLPAWVIGVAIHELGHLIVGKLVGLNVVACGIGIHRPFCWFTWRGVTFYFGRPITAGLNLFVIDDFRWPRREMISMILAGPLASLLLALVAWLLWQFAIAPTPLAALFWMAAFAAFATLIPAQVRRGPVTLSTDGLNAWRLLQNRSRLGQTPPGLVLSTQLDLSQTCQRIDCLRGTISTTLAAALMQASLEDGNGALKTLEANCLRDPRRAGWGESLELYVRAAALQHTGSTDAPLALVELDRVANRSPELALVASLLRVDMELDRQAPVDHLLPVVANAAATCARPEFTARWLVSQLVAGAPEDMESQASKLLKEQVDMPLLTALRLRTEVARQLVVRGRMTEAQTWFQAANSQLATIASTIASPETRERFLASYAKRLRKIVDQAPAEASFFVASATTDADRGDPARRWAMLMLAIAAAGVAIIPTALFKGDLQMLHGATAVAIAGGLLGAAASGRAIWLSARTRAIMGLLLIVNLDLALAGFALLVRIEQRQRPDSNRDRRMPANQLDRAAVPKPIATPIASPAQ